MQRSVVIAVTLALISLPACGSSASDAAVRKTLERGIAQISKPQTAKQLHDGLVRTLARLRRESASTSTGRKGRMLAIQGFTWTLRGIEAELEMIRNDSGNLEASVEDAKRSDRDRRRGAKLLRAAGLALGVR
jgi:hypothetical protein